VSRSHRSYRSYRSQSYRFLFYLNAQEFLSRPFFSCARLCFELHTIWLLGFYRFFCRFPSALFFFLSCFGAPRCALLRSACLAPEQKTPRAILRRYALHYLKIATFRSLISLRSPATSLAIFRFGAAHSFCFCRPALRAWTKKAFKTNTLMVALRAFFLFFFGL